MSVNMILDTEELTEYFYNIEKYDELNNNVLETIAAEERAMNDLDGIFKQFEIESSATISSETINIGFDTLTALSLEYFGDNEVNTTSLSAEALDGERVKLIKRFIKRITDLGSKILDTIETLKAVGGLITDYNSGILISLRKSLANDDVVVIKNKSIDASSVTGINKKLGIYYEMNNSKLTSKDLIKHLDIPYQMIVKEKLFTDLAEYCYDQLIVGRISLIGEDKEDIIPVNKASVEYLGKFKSHDIKKWLNRDIKAGIIDRLIGARFSIVSVYQDNKGADARHDFFKVKSSVYNNDIDVMSKKELLDLIDYGIECGKRFDQIGDIAVDGMWNNTWLSIRSSFMTTIYNISFGILAIKRQWRFYFMATEFYKGIMKAMLMQNKSYKDIPILITGIVSKMTESNR